MINGLGWQVTFLSPTLSLSLPLSLSLFIHPSVHPPPQNFVLSKDWFLQVTDSSVSARGATPLTHCNAHGPTAGRGGWSTIYIRWGPTKGQLAYVSATRQYFFTESLPLPPSSWKAAIFSFLLKHFWTFGLDVSSHLDKWLYETYVLDFSPGPGGGGAGGEAGVSKAGSHFHPGRQAMSRSWRRLHSDGVHRCNNPTPTPTTCHKTTLDGGRN